MEVNIKHYHCLLPSVSLHACRNNKLIHGKIKYMNWGNKSRLIQSETVNVFQRVKLFI
jgi:hypothetical protein